MKTGNFVGIIVAAAALLALSITVVMLLWNSCLVGVVAGVSEVTWLQAGGITVLVSLLTNAKLNLKYTK
jgi:hypothetical protein